MSSTDEPAVRALYQRLMDGWNQGSGTAFAEPMAADVDFVPFDGVSIKGRDALARFHDPLFKTHLKRTRLVGEVTGERFLAAFQNTRVRPIGQNFAGTMWWLLTDWLWRFARPRG